VIGAIDNILKSNWESPVIDPVGDIHPSLEETWQMPYQTPFHEPADSEDQLMRDLGPALPVIASAATGRVMAGPSVERAAVKETEELVDLASAERRRHVLDGEARADGSHGGGHRPGTGFPGKSEFPAGWSDDKIMHEISDVATDPKSVVNRVQAGGRDVFLRGTRDGVEIEVLMRNGQIWTGYPVNLPRNP